MKRFPCLLMLTAFTIGVIGVNAYAVHADQKAAVSNENAVTIISSTPISDEEIDQKYAEYEADGSAFLTDISTSNDAAAMETDESLAPIIISSTPISDEEIDAKYEQNTGSHLTDDGPQTRGDKIPSSVYNLSDMSYTGNFNFKEFVYTDKCFKTPYGMMHVVVSAKAGSSDKSYNLSMWKKTLTGASLVSGTDLTYGKEHHIEFLIKDTSAKYFFKLQKGNTGSYAKGTIEIS